MVLRSKKVTLQNIADKVGCSKNAVSLVLRERGKFSAEKRQAIKHIAKSMGYVPNFAARSLTLNRSGLIGIFLHLFFDPVRIEYIRHLLWTSPTG